MSDPTVLTRKCFIKTFAVSLAYSAFRGKSWADIFASEIRPSASTSGTLRLRLQDFPALQNETGSVRIAINPINGSQGPNGTFYPVVITRGANNAFFAVSSRCTHEGCIVEAFDPSLNQISCFCHGSVYAMDGRRISGPASSSLTKYTVSFNGSDRLSVQVPGLGYSMTVASVQPSAAGSRRLQLTFRSFRNVEYQVQYRPTVESVPTIVPFSLTAAGPTDQTSYTARSATNTNLFVESDLGAGFYTVAIVLSEV